MTGISFMSRQRLGPERIVMHSLLGLAVMLLLGSVWPRARAEPAQPCVAESGSLIPTVVPSRIYGKPVAVNVYLPPCYQADGPARYPVIYLLHGNSADETQWPDLNVQRAADGLISQGAPPFVVIMPGAAYSERIDYGAFVIRELLPGIEAQYPVQAVRS